MEEYKAPKDARFHEAHGNLRFDRRVTPGGVEAANPDGDDEEATSDDDVPCIYLDIMEGVN